MSLEDLDRPIVTWHFEPWGRDVSMRRISAAQLAALQVSYGSVSTADATAAEMLKFYAELLSLSVVDPQASADEWFEQTTTDTLIKIGEQAARVSGLAYEQKKTD